MSKPKLLTGPECADLLDRLAPDWPLLLYDGAVIDHILKVINNARGPHRSQRSYQPRLRSRQRVRVRQKTVLAQPQLLRASAPSESGSDPVKRLA
jgi:gamma-glutamyltranspeptidase